MMVDWSANGDLSSAMWRLVVVVVGAVGEDDGPESEFFSVPDFIGCDKLPRWTRERHMHMHGLRI